MQISKRCEYALRTLIDLGLAQASGREFVASTELATQERIPRQFLEQILFQLNAAGLVTSKRGKFGGYALTPRAHQTTFAELVRLIDGPLAPIRCVSEVAYQRCTCPDETHCGLRMLMADVRSAVLSVMDERTLGDVIESTFRRLHRDRTEHPFAPRQKSRARS